MHFRCIFGGGYLHIWWGYIVGTWWGTYYILVGTWWVHSGYMVGTWWVCSVPLPIQEAVLWWVWPLPIHVHWRWCWLECCVSRGEVTTTIWYSMLSVRVSVYFGANDDLVMCYSH